MKLEDSGNRRAPICILIYSNYLSKESPTSTVCTVAIKLGHTLLHTHTQSNALKHYPSVPSQTLNVLQTQLKAVLSKLPEDLQSCLKTAFSEA